MSDGYNDVFRNNWVVANKIGPGLQESLGIFETGNLQQEVGEFCKGIFIVGKFSTGRGTVTAHFNRWLRPVNEFAEVMVQLPVKSLVEEDGKIAKTSSTHIIVVVEKLTGLSDCPSFIIVTKALSVGALFDEVSVNIDWSIKGIGIDQTIAV